MTPAEKRVREIAAATEWSGDLRVNMNRLIDTVRAAVELLDAERAEVKRLQAIVAKLPKTADGKVVLWGDTVWSAGLHEWTVTGIAQEGMIEVTNARGFRFWRPAADHWSTLGAAAAAGGGG